LPTGLIDRVLDRYPQGIFTVPAQNVMRLAVRIGLVLDHGRDLKALANALPDV
jgi:hypothetical protein